MFLSLSLHTFYFFLQPPNSLSPGCKTPGISLDGFFFFFFLDTHLSRRVTFQDTINGGENVRTGDLIHQSRFCYLQLSINVALDGPCVSSPPARCRLLFCPPPLTSSWRGEKKKKNNGTIPPRRQLSQPSATHTHASPSEGEEKKCVTKSGGQKGEWKLDNKKKMKRGLF